MHQNQYPQTVAQVQAMPICPHCHSQHVVALGHGRKVGGTVGTVAGAASGMASAMSGAEIGAALGLLAGPVGAFFGGIAGALLGGVAGGAAGGVAGAHLGRIVDDNILDNHQCLSCGYAFSKQYQDAFSQDRSR